MLSKPIGFIKPVKIIGRMCTVLVDSTGEKWYRSTKYDGDDDMAYETQMACDLRVLHVTMEQFKQIPYYKEEEVKTFKDLPAGAYLKSNDGEAMQVVFYDFYSTGEPIMCLANDKSMYPASEFDPKDWVLMKGESNDVL